MLFNQHPSLAGRHAFLSPSSPHWLNYNDQKLDARFTASQAARRGTDIHKFAHEAIRLGIKLDKRSYPALATYVSDALGYRMVAEQPLYYTDNCFGTADTICFRRSVLRIHDLKTGITKTSIRQLEIYAALFCLEYGYDPRDIRIVLRIYQRDDFEELEPIPEAIVHIMEKIIDFDQQLERIKEESW